MTPRPKSEEKKIAIIMAAMNTFAKHGLEKGTISTIAKEAGIGKGTVYQYFQSKEEIFEQIIYVMFEEMFTTWQQTITSDLSPKQKLEMFIDLTVDVSLEMINSENKDQFSMLMEIFLYSFRNQDKIKIDEIMQRIYKIFEPIFSEGVEKGEFQEVDPEYLGFIIFAFFDGFGLHYFFQYKHYDAEKLKTTMKNLLLNGLLK